MKDIIVGIISLSLGVFIIMLCRDLPIFIAKGYPGPSFFPLILSSISLICGLVLVVRSYRGMKMSGGNANLRQNIKLLGNLVKDIPVRNAIKFIVLMAVYILLIPHIGFLLTSMLFMFIVQVAYGVSMSRALTISFAAILSIYLLFIVVLKVVVPEPILGTLVFR